MISLVSVHQVGYPAVLLYSGFRECANPNSRVCISYACWTDLIKEQRQPFWRASSKHISRTCHCVSREDAESGEEEHPMVEHVEKYREPPRELILSLPEFQDLGPGMPTGGLLNTIIPLESAEMGWCSLCGSRCGWMQCGHCEGKGTYITKPGLAGVKGKVGIARCKTCFGRCVVPCLLCGITDVDKWEKWHAYAQKRPHKRQPPSV